MRVGTSHFESGFFFLVGSYVNFTTNWECHCDEPTDL